MRPRKTILLVDRDDLALSRMRFLLELRGYRVIGSASEVDAISEAKVAKSIDLFLWIEERGGNFSAAISGVQEMHPQASTMIIAKHNGLRRAATAWVEAFLVKPTPEEMLERIRILVQRKRGPKRQGARGPAGILTA